MNVATAPVLALDPGKDKTGLAIVAPPADSGHMPEVLAQQIVRTDDVDRVLPPLLQQWKITQIVLGDATTSAAWQARLEVLAPEIPIALVREANSTFEARALYWRAHPPRGWRRVLPLSLQLPPDPLDDFAAVILAQRFFAQQFSE